MKCARINNMKFEQLIRYRKKLFVVGLGGSGKTTFAMKLAQTYGAVHVNLDIMWELFSDNLHIADNLHKYPKYERIIRKFFLKQVYDEKFAVVEGIDLLLGARNFKRNVLPYIIKFPLIIIDTNFFISTNRAIKRDKNQYKCIRDYYRIIKLNLICWYILNRLKRCIKDKMCETTVCI